MADRNSREAMIGAPLARLLRSLAESCCNEGSDALVCRLMHCKTVIDGLLSDRAVADERIQKLERDLRATRTVSDQHFDTILTLRAELDEATDRAQQGEPVAVKMAEQLRAVRAGYGSGDYIMVRPQMLDAAASEIDRLFRVATKGPAPAGAPTINPMCERKTNIVIERDGYEKTGYVLRKAGADICVSDGGAVAWFTLDQWNWLMFNRMHTTFDWPKPIGWVAAPEGYVLLPEVPTNRMVCAIEAAIDSQLVASAMAPAQMFRQDGARIYEALLESIPGAQKEGDEHGQG